MCIWNWNWNWKNKVECRDDDSHITRRELFFIPLLLLLLALAWESTHEAEWWWNERNGFVCCFRCILTTLLLLVHFIQSFRSLFYICAFVGFCSHAWTTKMSWEHTHTHVSLNIASEELQQQQKIQSTRRRLDNLRSMRLIPELSAH